MTNVSPDAYDSPSWWYDIRGYFILRFSYRDTLISQVRFFSSNLSSAHLEAAIGSGSLLKIIIYYLKIFDKNQSQYHITGIDYAPSIIAGA